MTKCRRTILILIGILLSVLAILFIGYVRFQLIKHETYKGILNEDVDFVYHHKDKPHDKQEFMRDIYQLAVWKNEKLEEIDHLFIISDSYTSMYPYYSKPNGFSNRDAIVQYCKDTLWKKLHNTLSNSVHSAVAGIFNGRDTWDGHSLEGVASAFFDGRSDTIINAVDELDAGNAFNAYIIASIPEGSEDEFEITALPMDVIYTLNPELVMSGIEKDLSSAIKSDDYDTLNDAFNRANIFGTYYNLNYDEIPCFSEAFEKLGKLGYEKRPEVPYVGMTYGEALGTKLGFPFETEKGHYSGGHKSYDTIKMRGGKKGNVIFDLECHDGVVVEVNDWRK